MIWETTSEDETIAVGRTIAGIVGGNALVLLTGDLGAGKTTLAKGIVNGLNGTHPEEVSSPTYTLIHEYGENPTVYHVDLYRLEDDREVDTLGLDELFGRPAAVLIEWGERFPRLLPAERWEVSLAYQETGSGEGVERREIRLRKNSAPA